MALPKSVPYPVLPRGLVYRDEVPFRGQVLERGVEADVVHGVRATVDVEDERPARAGVEVGRLDDPALHARTVGRAVPDFLDLAQRAPREQVIVDAGQPLEAPG